VPDLDLTTTDPDRQYRETQGLGGVSVPEWVIVQEMDRARHRAVEAMTTHDRWAVELGYERVPIEDINVGDRVALVSSWGEVTLIEPRIVDRGGWCVLALVTSEGTVTGEYGDLVSRKLTDPGEPF
jgi:hypothetical protein